MKSLVIAFLSLSVFTAHADRVETVNLDAFQKVFEVPTDAKNFQVRYLLPKKKIATERTTTYQDNCSYDDSPASFCNRSTDKTEPGYALDVVYSAESRRDIETMSSAQDLTINFRGSEFRTESISTLPIPKWYGKGMKANHLAAQKLVNLVVEDLTRLEQVVDESESVYCERDVESGSYNTRCEDRIVYKPAMVTRRYLTVQVK